MSLVVRPVRGLRDLRKFIDLPYRLHSTSPVWVPPLRIERYQFLSRRFNVFFKHGDAQLFLAERDGRVVGRISAHYDDNFNAYHDNRWGMFGFLEIEDEPDVLPALLEAAETWLKAHGRDRMVGPMDFTVNDEFGVQIEGFEREPMIRQPWHPPYYAARCEEAGLRKAIDTYMWELHISDRSKILPVIFKLAEEVEPRHGIRLRKMSRRGLRRDLDRFADVYNAAWSENWGFVPYGKADLDQYAAEMQLVFDHALVHGRRDRRGRDRGGGDHRAGHQPGAQAHEGPAAAARLVALPAPPQDHGPRARRLPRRQAGVPAHRRGGRHVRRALRHGERDAAEVGRDGLDPRDQPRT